MLRSKNVKTISAFTAMLLTGAFVAGCVSSEGELEAKPAIDVAISDAKAPITQPNIIVILTDDQGYSDVGFNGSVEIPTPNIDRIAYEGVRFDQGYVSFPVCGPSRAGLLTGRYQSRFGFDLNPSESPDDPKAGLPVTEHTIAEVLKPVGYTSMIVGKWHMGLHESFHPNNRGFDQFFGFLNGGHNYFTDRLRDIDPRKVERASHLYQDLLMRNKTKVVTSGYLTDVLSDEAVNFIDDNKENPFFLFLSYNAPHTPMHASQKYLDRFPNIEDKRRKTYAAMVSAVDDGVGKVLNSLEENDIEENTLVFFLSDNGGPLKRAVNSSINLPFRGGKGDVFEGGVRVPFAMRWPAQVPAGIDYPHPVSSLDILATAVAANGIDKKALKNPLDGVNLIPFVNQADYADMPHDQLFWRMRDKRRDKESYYATAVVEGDMKYVRAQGETGLYDLTTDKGEQNSIIKDNRSDAKRLKDDHDAWSEDMIDLDISIFNQWPTEGNPD